MTELQEQKLIDVIKGIPLDSWNINPNYPKYHTTHRELNISIAGGHSGYGYWLEIDKISFLFNSKKPSEEFYDLITSIREYFDNIDKDRAERRKTQILQCLGVYETE